MRSHLTSNQQRALALANRLIDDATAAPLLDDSDWHLLLLAAGLSGARSRPAFVVAERTLDYARRRVGYFARGEALHFSTAPDAPRDAALAAAGSWDDETPDLRRPAGAAESAAVCPVAGSVTDMPWKIIPAAYDPLDSTTLHDDELVAIEQALAAQPGPVANEYNPGWRALQKVRPLAQTCTGDDPVHLLPPGAAGPPHQTRAALPARPAAAG